MEVRIDEALSREVAQKVKSKSRKPFDNAYRAALAVKGATYVQGFSVAGGGRCKLVEHSWIEVGDRAADAPEAPDVPDAPDAPDTPGVVIVDPNLPYLNASTENLYYFPAHRLTPKQLKAAVEEAKEDYPDDDPLPIYGEMPYEYYGDVMLGGQDHLLSYQAAEAKYTELTQARAAQN